MIGGVRGRISRTEPGAVMVETAGGLVMRIMVPVSSYAELGEGSEVFLYTSLHLRDDRLHLFGFPSQRQRRLFDTLTAISGIGGKTALAMISAFSVEEMASIIDAGDFLRLSTVPGIGRKTAQRVVLEMSGRLGRVLEGPGEGEPTPMEEDLVSGLVNLGFSARPARQAVRRMLASPEGREGEFADLFKRVLKQIGGP